MTEEQVDLIREAATGYSRLEWLTRLPDSLESSSPGKIVEEIRSVAVAYVVNEVLDRTLREESSGDYQKQKLSIPGTIVSPFIDIPVMEFDPMDLV